MKIDLKNVNAGTVARTLILLLALVNQCLTVAGFSVLPISDEQIESLVSTVWTAAAALWAWWKNNSITPAAIEADKIKADLTEGREIGGSKGETESQKGVRE